MFTLAFEFDRNVRGTEQINEKLASMRLSELHIRTNDGYLATKRTFDRDNTLVSTEYEYGFDKLELECEDGAAEERHVYQIDAAAFPKGEIASSDQYHDLWCADHPGRVMRVLQQISYDTADAFVVLHHERA